MKDRNLWMKKEEKRTAPGLKRALKAVLGHKIVRLAGIAGVSLLFSASAAQTVSGSRWRMVIIWWEWTVLT